MGDIESADTTREFDSKRDGTRGPFSAGAWIREAQTIPQKIGRYRIESLLGRGGFGLVFLAKDDLLNRMVAIKVPHRARLESQEDVESYLAEARTVASLDHPHIVPVYDVGSTTDFACFIVSKYIDGTDLFSHLKNGQLVLSEAVSLAATVAEALHFAHKRGFVHRDIKPGNILLGKNGESFVADFGLALREDQFGTQDFKICGTPHYMSPEQARGESHLVDGRADIFSLGVVLYEMLTGTRPFGGSTPADVLRAVISHDPRPIRQRSEHVPRELERITMLALAKRASERYSTAKDFADDLRQFLQQSEHVSQNQPLPVVAPADVVRDSRSGRSTDSSLTVIPKGLHAFDESDRDFFLGLVPGAHDRDGLPQCLRFWKDRIEQPENPVRVGVVYGPSGCGKSSLIRAGLLPRMAPSIQTIVITATSGGTEQSLLDALNRLLPQPATTVVAAIQRLRRGSACAQRVLIVIDQFEQWLHSNRSTAETNLVHALRQCDGEHVSCLLTVRDDFWMSIHRFFRELDIRLAELDNCAAVDLFDTRHARRVLHAFGFAYGALPERSEQLSEDQRAFLDRSIVELAEDDRVICVRLALFAQMVRNRPWATATLVSIGGARGVGIRFLEDAFGSTSSPLSYRTHRTEISAILRALLPAPGTDIKACTRTIGELAQSAGCDVTSEDFRSMLAILEHDTRLVTPADTPQTAEAASGSEAEQESRTYQLTHDYLVPSIREWLSRRQQGTWRGRCELRLEDRARLWAARPEQKQLPSLWETVQITLGTRSLNWSAQQQQMMNHSLYWHGKRLAFLGVLLLSVLIGSSMWHAASLESQRRQSANSVVDRLLVAEAGRIVPLLTEIQATRDVWIDRLRTISDRADSASIERQRALMALVPTDRRKLPELLMSLVDADVPTIHAVREWLRISIRPGENELLPESGTGWPPEIALRIAALADVIDSQPDKLLDSIASSVTNSLVTNVSLDIEAWAELMFPARDKLVPLLADKLRSTTATSAERNTTAQLLSKLGATGLLCGLAVDADATQFALLMRPLIRDHDTAVANMLTLLAEKSVNDDTDARLRWVNRQRNVAVALLLLGRDDLVWPLLGTSADASLRTELMLNIRSYGVPIEILLRAEENVRDPIARQAIWQCLASGGVRFATSEKDAISERIRSRWGDVATQSERAGIVWLASRIGLSELPGPNRQEAPRKERDWSINSLGRASLRVRGPVEFQMGSPVSERRRMDNERQHRRRIDRHFEICAYKVTTAEYRMFNPAYIPDQDVAPADDCPAIAITWLDAARFCRWLSEREGVPENQMCYPSVDQIHPGMTFPSDLLTRTGFRLPTEAEWEYVCRSGASERYFFGENDRYLSEFGWWIGNSGERTWPIGQLRPNPFGVFDILGNVQEWCQDAIDDYPQDSSVLAETRSLTDENSRIVRGAHYRAPGRSFRSANRGAFSPDTQLSIIGFRLARSIAE